MQKWEYLSLTTSQLCDGSYSQEPQVAMVDFQEQEIRKKKGFLAGWEYEGICEWLSRLGEDGWELVAVLSDSLSSSDATREYVLKRPKD